MSNKRSDFPAPMVLRTTIDDVWNPVDGKRYSCRRAYEKAVVASGGRIVGNDLPLDKPQKPEIKLDAKADIAKAFDQHS